MEKVKNDLSLLRPFDLEKARAGEAVCWEVDGDVPKYFSVTPAGNVVANFKASFSGENLWGPQDFRMAPLCWVEGKPVYNGDVLYRPGINDGPVIVQRILTSGGTDYLKFEDGEGTERVGSDKLTWTKPKKKRTVFVNVYPNGDAYWYETKEIADNASYGLYIICKTTMEIEE